MKKEASKKVEVKTYKGLQKIRTYAAYHLERGLKDNILYFGQDYSKEMAVEACRLMNEHVTEEDKRWVPLECELQFQVNDYDEAQT